MKTGAKVRFVIFIIIHIFLCYLVVGFSVENSGLKNLVDDVTNLYIDGEDITSIANFFVGIGNGMLWIISSVVISMAMLFFTVILLVPFCFISFRKQSVITEFEELWTKRIIIWGFCITYLISLIFTELRSIFFPMILIVPAFLLEFLLYWMRLKKQKNNNVYGIQ